MLRSSPKSDQGVAIKGIKFCLVGQEMGLPVLLADTSSIILTRRVADSSSKRLALEGETEPPLLPPRPIPGQTTRKGRKTVSVCSNVVEQPVTCLSVCFATKFRPLRFLFFLRGRTGVSHWTSTVVTLAWRHRGSAAGLTRGRGDAGRSTAANLLSCTSSVGEPTASKHLLLV